MADPKYILVVDDDPDLVETVSMNLEAKGYEVGKAYDGQEAEESIAARQPDLVVLDVMMPRKNGYELCDEMKKDQALKTIPVLLLTAVGSAVNSTSYTHVEGMQMEADEYLAKPVDMDKLLELVADLLA
jgi:DNA-binding response OmpR family regulator